MTRTRSCRGDPVDPVDTDVDLTVQLHRFASKVLFKNLACLASMEQKKSRRLFLTSCHAGAQYLMKNIFIPFLQFLPFAQVEEGLLTGICIQIKKVIGILIGMYRNGMLEFLFT